VGLLRSTGRKILKNAPPNSMQTSITLGQPLLGEKYVAQKEIRKEK
jgi:hypothetical protein